jgi:hypothetical protein
MNISRQLKKLFIRGGIYREQAGEGAATGGAGPLDPGTGANLFSSFLGGEAQAESESEESEESAAERLAAEEAAGANQNNAEGTDGEQQDQQGQDGTTDTVTFQVDGKDVTLTKAELAELHKGGLRQQDYTRKTMEAAEQRKTADAEIQKARAERDSYQQKLHAFALTQEAIIADSQKILTQELLDTDPVEYLSQQRILHERQANLSAAQQELQRIGAEQQQERQRADQDFLKAQFQTLIDKLPEWKDPVKQKASWNAIEGFMEERGFKPEDGRVVLDARVILLANDAMKYRDLMKRAAEAGKKVAKVPPKVERPGVTPVNPTDGRTQAMKRLAQTGSVRDAAALFSAFT